MALKDHQLVAHVDVETYRRFNALAEHLGDLPSALLRKLVMKALGQGAGEFVGIGPSSESNVGTSRSPKE